MKGGPDLSHGFHLKLLDPYKEQIELALEEFLPHAAEDPPRLHEAMRYSVLGGGKRIRAILCMLAAEVFRVPPERSAPVAACLELLHAYSLIHDDLPCMDDSALRRGRPTCHKIFGDAIAVLAGDALLTMTFEVLTVEGVRAGLSPTVLVEMVMKLAHAAGSRALIGGQTGDLEAEGKEIGLEALRSIHRRKTGALITASLELGALMGQPRTAELATVVRYGQLLGELFQVTDDILDVISDAETLGKPTAADSRHEKATFPRLLGLAGAREHADTLAREAKAQLRSLPERDTRLLEELALYLPRRER